MVWADLALGYILRVALIPRIQKRDRGRWVVGGGGGGGVG